MGEVIDCLKLKIKDNLWLLKNITVPLEYETEAFD